MHAATHSLEKVAAEAQAEMASRVVNEQGGVFTFFDNFLNGLLARLKAAEAVHGWNATGNSIFVRGVSVVSAYADVSFINASAARPFGAYGFPSVSAASKWL